MSVVALKTAVDESVVKMLEDLLVEAKEAKLTGLVLYAFKMDNEFSISWVGGPSKEAVIGALFRAATELAADAHTVVEET